MSPRVTAIHPLCAIEGGRITIEGTEFPVDGRSLPDVRVGELAARLVYASPTRTSGSSGPSTGNPVPSIVMRPPSIAHNG